ncbi:hypothetical protein [Salinarimonas rosea]|uniref:hypothetical protein n=1 Tax=Salinarimonas rosea TaxID=552063 RepID=UPI00048C57BC|nr:hypothetical protein [Salinarimonas rosea]
MHGFLRPVPSWLRAALLLGAPVLAILAARVLTKTALAGEYPRAAALLFLWIAADALALATIAKAPDRRPGLRAILGAFAAACLIVPIAAAAPVREALFGMPAVSAAMALTLALYAFWSVTEAAIRLRQSGSLAAAVGEILPRRLVDLVHAELSMAALALFRWNVPADIPAGAQAFAYHRHLTPMVAAFLVLQLIELAVVHLLVGLWSETAALVLLALSVWGVIWLVALLKSFRIYPVLVHRNAVVVRAGSLVDETIPLDAIARRTANFDSERLKSKRTLNAAVLAWPNVFLELGSPIQVRTVFGGRRTVDAVAFRLDDPAPFFRQLDAATGA